MFTLKTGEATHKVIEGVTYLEVPYNILIDGGDIIYSVAQLFPLTATADEIKEAMSNALAVYKEDHERHEGAKENQAQLDSSAEVAGEISNLNF